VAGSKQYGLLRAGPERLTHRHQERLHTASTVYEDHDSVEPAFQRAQDVRAMYHKDTFVQGK